MCLAIPGKVVETFERKGLRMGRVQFGGIVRESCLEYVPAAQAGDYVLVHVGFALSVVDEQEAARTYRLLEELGQLSELEAPQPPDDAADAPPSWDVPPAKEPR
jgi:hydrogenase expression/formation protein HypC